MRKKNEPKKRKKKERECERKKIDEGKQGKKKTKC